MPKANERKWRPGGARAQALGAYFAKLYRRTSAKLRLWPAPARRAIVGGLAVAAIVAVLGVGGGTLVHGLLNWELNRLSGVDLARHDSTPLDQTPLAVRPPEEPSPSPEPQEEGGVPPQLAGTGEPAPETGSTPAAQAAPATEAAPAPDASPQSTAAQPAAAAVDLSRLYWPLAGSIVQASGWARDPITQVWRYQPGVTVRGKPGDPVHAALAGTVVAVGVDARGVPQVAVDDGDSWRTTYTGAFAAGVEVGQKLAAGDVVGRLEEATGATEQVQDPTGESRGAWLRFEITHAGEAIDPMPYAPHGAAAAG